MPVQDAIFSMEAGQGRRLMEWVAVGIGVLALVLVHMAGQFRGLRYAEAMDQAQVARNIARGKGYVTSVLRPLEIGDKLRRQNNGVMAVAPLQGDRMEETRQAPLYPAVLAAVFTATFQDFGYGGKQGEAAPGVEHYFPDRVVAGFGMACMLAAAGFLFSLGKALFDRKAAVLAVALFLGTDSVWQLALSGLDACFMMMLLTASVWAWQRALMAEETPEGPGGLSWLALGSGLQALMVLGRYGWWWVGIASFLLAFFCFRNRVAAAGIVSVTWLVVPGVWFVRNMMVAGNPLGTALWFAHEGMGQFPAESLWGHLRPDTSRVAFKSFVGAMMGGVRGWVEKWPVASGSIVAACFFIVALLHRFRRPRVEALKWWTLGAAVLAMAGSAFGFVREYSASEPGNMLILFSPVIALFAAAMLFVVLDRAQFEIVELRRGLILLAVGLNAAPMVLTILPPQEPPVCWPPYFGQVIKLAGAFFKENEVVASDIPEAMAWYGDRRTLLLPPSVKEFNEINDFVLAGSTKGLLFSPATLDGRLFTEVLSGRGREWAPLFLQRRAPELFPLQAGTALPPRLGDMYGYLLYADKARWQKQGSAPAEGQGGGAAPASQQP